MKEDRDVSLFVEALNVPADEREHFLKAACSGDEALRARVERLLEAHDCAGRFMEQGPAELADLGSAGPSVGEKPGDLIGRYKLLQQIGEGGYGVVFMAEQEEPIRRKVALKVIKPGMDTRSVMARFEAERQALAMMDHPNIAKVFYAGATERGRPYFVMELVRGVKILEYCDECALTTEERLRLFVQICRAVQHAHQKGIIHRDLKPSNIMVSTTVEGEPLPVVIDFGIAKATNNQRLTDKTLFTAYEMLVGTPAYMSPEQAELSGVDVDTRTDIYSLGVLLYELLTGSTPFDSQELMKAGLDEIRRVIREKEPARPSTRLSAMTPADLRAAAERRRAAPPALVRSMQGDLDWIVMKALEKDRTRRYPTAHGLALDVERYLAHEPVSARPPSTLYKLGKMASRNKLLFGCVIAVLALLVTSLLLVSASWNNERKARKKAELAQARSEQATAFFKSMLAGVGPSVARGRDTVMLREILDKTANQIEASFGSQPELEAEMRALIGGLYLDIGDYPRAEQMQSRAVALYREAKGDRSPETAAALTGLGSAFWKERKLKEAEAAHREALEIRRTVFGNESKEVATSLNHLGGVYRRQHRLAEAEAVTREALAIRERLHGHESLEAADSLRNLSIILGDQERRPEAEALAREMLRIRQRLLPSNDPAVGSALADAAWAVGYTGKMEEAEAFERQAFEVQREVLGDKHPDVAKAIFSLGERLRQRGQLTEAEAILSAAISIQKKVLGDSHQAVLDSLRSLGWTLDQERKWAQSEIVHQEALAGLSRQSAPDNARVAAEVAGLGRALEGQRKFAELEELLAKSLTPELVQNPASADLLALRASMRGRKSQWAEAAQDATLAFRYQPLNDERAQVLGVLYARLRDTQAYEEHCATILQSFGETKNPFAADKIAKTCLLLPSASVDARSVARLADVAVTEGQREPWAMPFFYVCKALTEFRQGHWNDAMAWAKRVEPSSHIHAEAQACALLAMLQWRLGAREQANAYLNRGNELVPLTMPRRDAEDSGPGWLAWLFARISLDEANAFIQRTEN